MSAPVEQKKENKFITPLFFVVIFLVLFTFIILALAYSQAGCQCCSVAVCSGDLWYNCIVGS